MLYFVPNGTPSKYLHVFVPLCLRVENKHEVQFVIHLFFVAKLNNLKILCTFAENYLHP